MRESRAYPLVVETLMSRQRKTDFTIIPPLLAIYLLSYIDRSNVGNIKL